MEAIEQWIKQADISTLARPCYADEDLANTCIMEAQNLDIRPQIGDELYMAIANEFTTSRVRSLMGMEVFKDKNNHTRMHFGLSKALAYYAYARIVKTGSNTQTRYGFVSKNDENSTNTSLKERINAYDDAFAMGDDYMKGVVDYIVANASSYPEYSLKGKMKNNRIMFRKIGK